MGALLTGSISGHTRKEMVDYATEIAATYFGLNCVRVSLTEETSETISVRTAGGHIAANSTSFTADFTAEVWHDIEVKSYGMNLCRKCGAKSWPDSRLAGDPT